MASIGHAPARVERVFAGAYGPGEAPSVGAALGSGVTASAATSNGLSVAWTGSSVPVPPGADSLACLLDGEIHNSDEIADLAGMPLGTPPEAALAAAYGRLGEQLVTRLRGEFALLIWDPRSGVGLLARDQLGSGTIFIRAVDGRLLFATELSPLLDALPRTPGPDDQALVQWLVEGTVPADRTVYQGVVPLPPASLLRLRAERWEIIRYWAPRYVEPRPLDRDDAAARLRREVIGAVGRPLRGRRMAGILLSGGLDSATVLAAAHRAVDHNVASLRVYSAVFPRHPSMDESGLIGLQVGHHRVRDMRLAVIGGSPMRGALRYLDRWRVPLPAPGHFIWEPLLAEAAGDGAECLLDGEAGDELFGPAPLLIADRLERGRLRGALRLARGLPGTGPSPSRRLVASLLGRYGLAPCLPGALGRPAGTRADAPWWLDRRQTQRDSPGPDAQSWRSLDGPRWWAQLADAITRAPDRLGFFDYYRRRGRAAGVPAQHPFLDLDLIETVLGLPPEYGFDPNLSRPLLRHAMRGLVPEPVRARRDKSYFDPLLIDSLAGNDRHLLRRLLTAPDAEVRRFADPTAVRALVDGGPDGHPRGERSWMRDVWRLATAECWLRSQVDRGFAQGLLDQPSAPPRRGEPGPSRRGGRSARSYVFPP
jgi:asparagine synthase (glutamine-hydrolysing)